jgi:hypothetical protein
MRKLTQAEVVARFRSNDLEVLEPYQGSQTPILCQCLKCNYERRAYPHSVFAGCRCPNCANQVRLTQLEVAARFEMRGMELLGEYINNDLPILVRCKQCRYERRIKPNFAGAIGCPKCANNLSLTKADVVERFTVNGFKVIEPYRNTRTLIRVRCIKCKYERRARPNHIFQGMGCPNCADYGFQPSKPGTLYYVRVTSPFGDPLYKIGITNKSVGERFGKDFTKVTIIETWHFEHGAEAFEMEQDILKDYDAHRWTGPDVLESGNDELFIRDVLGLDKGQGQIELLNVKPGNLCLKRVKGEAKVAALAE